MVSKLHPPSNILESGFSRLAPLHVYIYLATSLKIPEMMDWMMVGLVDNQVVGNEHLEMFKQSRK